jgi:hypothetical protein
MNKEPRILIYDIESAPLLAYSWGPMYDANLLTIVEDWYLLSFSYKWYGEDTIRFERKAAKKGDDKSLVKKLWRLFDEADAVLAHNGDRFDQKKSMARIVKHDLGPPSPYIEIDTLKLARQKFAFTSNKLDELAKFLDIGAKRPHQGMHTWYGCMNNDPEAWAVMEDYNKHDVELLDKVYQKLAPYVRTRLNQQAWDGTYRCVNCGSGNLESRGYRSRGGTERTHRNWKCLDCGKWNYELLSGVGKFRSV